MSELTLSLLCVAIAGALCGLILPRAVQYGLFRYPVGQGGRLGAQALMDIPAMGGVVAITIGVVALAAWSGGLLLALLLGGLTPIGVVALLYERRWKGIWGGTLSIARLKAPLFALSVAFPLAVLVSSVLSALLLAAGQHLGQQVAMQVLLRAKGHPFFLVMVLLQIIVLAPLTEEFIFRGLLQSLFRKYWSRKTAIVSSALLFAVVHLHRENGMANITALSGVFILGLFLGHLFEREKTLWAPVVLHTLFNVVSVVLALAVGV